jgi:hypothetical protein
MWTQIAGEQAQLQAIDQNPPGWTAGKKGARSIGAAGAREARISELLGLDGNVIRVTQPSFSFLPSRPLAFYGPLDPLGFAAANFPESALLA